MRITSAIVSEIRGRDYMEDRHTLLTDFIQRGWTFGGVYDGHGYGNGARCSEYAALRKPDAFQEATGNPEEQFRGAYKVVDEEMSWAHLGGTCAANFLIKGTTITTANAGDCRIVLVGDKLEQLTVDHRTTNAEEHARILSHGPYIYGQRVNFGDEYLMITRVLGDHHFLKTGVNALPFVQTSTIGKEHRFLVACSDGLTDKVSNDVVLHMSQYCTSAEALAAVLTDEVGRKNGHDNLTIIVLKFDQVEGSSI
jgi:serine/threonine protein phosphatase PrpC